MTVGRIARVPPIRQPAASLFGDRPPAEPRRLRGKGQADDDAAARHVGDPGALRAIVAAVHRRAPRSGLRCATGATPACATLWGALRAAA